MVTSSWAAEFTLPSSSVVYGAAVPGETSRKKKGILTARLEIRQKSHTILEIASEPSCDKQEINQIANPRVRRHI